jgi:regulator of protease activity HflC (stomatin/prohibitin superfamily)
MNGDPGSALCGALFIGLACVMVVLLFGSFYTVQQQTAAVIERLGKFSRIATAGLNLKIPILDRVVNRVNLRVQQIDVRVETKTEDNVFVQVMVSVQFFVIPAKVADAFYRLDHPAQQINAYVFDVVRARVPRIKLDALFANKDEIADAVKHELAEAMDDFGYGIVKALVTDIDPDAQVKQAMNEINAAQRNRVAATERGEADRILRVKSAEAEAQSKALQGKGIADQRRAIVDGLRDSVDHFSRAISGATPQDVMALIIATQYFDTLRDIAAHGRLNTVMLPHSPSAATDLFTQLRNTVISAAQVPGQVIAPAPEPPPAPVPHGAQPQYNQR